MPPILAAELTTLGYAVTATHAAGVELRGSFDDCIRLNLHLRTAHRVLFRVGSFEAATPTDVYRRARQIAWEEWIPVDGYMAVVSSVSTSSITNTQFANVKLKDAIVDRLRDRFGRRPDSGPRTDRTVVFLYWHGTTCMLYIDTSGTSLSDRGYRLDPRKAPLRESLAAAIILATAWNPQSAAPFVNPMCGSGTLAIEASMMACSMAPGLLRSSYGFMHVVPYRHAMWEAHREAARAAVHAPHGAIIASDNDRRSVMATKANAGRAGVGQYITTHSCDFSETPLPEKAGVIVMNPEYGLRLGDTEVLEQTYSAMGDWFKQHCGGWMGFIFTGNLELAKKVGLRTSKRIPLWNADIECRLLGYEMYAGSRKGMPRNP
jgi:23S rRNA G2445 N2-methylase RlmL